MNRFPPCVIEGRITTGKGKEFILIKTRSFDLLEIV
jgi:hypothetical protein